IRADKRYRTGDDQDAEGNRADTHGQPPSVAIVLGTAGIIRASAVVVRDGKISWRRTSERRRRDGYSRHPTPNTHTLTNPETRTRWRRTPCECLSESSGSLLPHQ